ncbi:unannotated protein [freshwater metagenome]|uniref:Unannotated protein n=1 Tax=freshwater metagenome TaxID=449393 RepID=A0A6J6PMT3_9ZZZZ
MVDEPELQQCDSDEAEAAQGVHIDERTWAGKGDHLAGADDLG